MTHVFHFPASGSIGAFLSAGSAGITARQTNANTIVSLRVITRPSWLRKLSENRLIADDLNMRNLGRDPKNCSKSREFFAHQPACSCPIYRHSSMWTFCGGRMKILG